MRLLFFFLIIATYPLSAQQININENNNPKDSIDFDYKEIEKLNMDIAVPDSLDDDAWIADSLNLDNLDIDTLKFDVYDADNYFGFFPHFSTDNLFHGLYISGSMKDFNKAHNVMPKGFFPAKSPFSDNGDLEDDMPELKTGFDNNETDDGYISDYFEIGYCTIITSPYFFPLHLQIGYQSINSSIFSIDESKHFVDHDNNLRKIKEANIIRLREHLAQVTLTTEIPIWGMGDIPSVTAVASYYYGLVGISGQFALYSKADQIMQLLSEETRIRYSNGNNYTYLMENQTVQNINSFRSHLVFGLGMNVLSDFGGSTISLQYKYPINSIIKDVDWKHHYFVLQIELFGAP